MFDRIFSILIGLGICALAVFLFQRHYAAPFCKDDTVTGQVTSQVSHDLGPDGYNLADIKQTSGALFSRVRECQMDVAPIIGLQTVDNAHWQRVLYTVKRSGHANAVTVAAHVEGPAAVHFMPRAS